MERKHHTHVNKTRVFDSPFSMEEFDKVYCKIKHGKPVGPGVGAITQISSVLLFSEYFSIVKIHVSYLISRLYLTGVAAAQMRLYLSNVNVIKQFKRYFCKIEKLPYGEINEQTFDNRDPKSFTKEVLKTEPIRGVLDKLMNTCFRLSIVPSSWPLLHYSQELHVSLCSV